MVTKAYLPAIDPVTGKRLMYGNGCARCKNCFECPFPDCYYNVGNEYYFRKANGNIKTA